MFKYLILFVLFGVTFGEPNFKECCIRKGLPEKCIPYCTYYFPHIFQPLRHELITPEIDIDCTVTAVMAPYFQCFQKEQDNRECCRDGNVDTEFPYCMDLCDGTRPVSDIGIYEKCNLLGIKDRIIKCARNAH